MDLILGASSASAPGIFSLEALAALGTLTLLEIVLGIDNVVFIAILTGKLPEAKQGRARIIGLLLAGAMRLVLLALAWLVIRASEPLFVLPFLSQVVEDPETHEEMTKVVAISAKDLMMLGGGLFLIAKATWEIHHLLEGGHEGATKKAGATMWSVIGQILLLDLVFSLDSVITAVGMTRVYWIMAAAVIISVGVMLFFAGPIGRFVGKHPSMKTLALAFLVMIGVLLVAEGLHQEFDRRYVYFSMAFALVVELINLKAGARRRAKASAGA